MLDSVNSLSVAMVEPICDPKVAIESPMLAIWREQAVGYEGLRRWFAGLRRVFAFIEVNGVSVEVGDGWVRGEVRLRARGVASPSELRWPCHVAITFTPRGGLDERIAEIGVYLSEREALAAIERFEAGGAITSQRPRGDTTRMSSNGWRDVIPTIAPPEPA